MASKFLQRHRAACLAGMAVILGGGIAVWKAVEAAQFRHEVGVVQSLNQREAHRAHITSMFVHELITALNVDEPVARRNALKEAIHYFEENLLPPVDEPEAVFQGLEMLGLSYMAMDEFADAERCLKEAIKVGRELFADETRPHPRHPGEPPPWFTVQLALGQVLHTKGRAPEAINLLSDLDREMCGLLGNGYRERELVLNELASAFDREERVEEASAVRRGLGDLEHFELPEK